MFHFKRKLNALWIAAILLLFLQAPATYGQTPRSASAERGSQIAKEGFRNENDVREKLNKWQDDNDAREWLRSLGHDPGSVVAVRAFKPHGQKSDVVVEVAAANGSTYRHGISIKLVSGATGFNQVDKRWLRQYVRMWDIPAEIVRSLRLFLGEDLPDGKSRRPDRMFLTELGKEERLRIVEFFTRNKERVTADLLRGEGEDKADFLMVVWRTGRETRSKIVPIESAIAFYSEGNVEVTRSGNLKIGRITMQRKGGDGGRETAKQLQFKINPVLLFYAD